MVTTLQFCNSLRSPMTPFSLRAVGVVATSVILMIALYGPQGRADDSARISRLESELRLLRTRVDEQQRRIARLEE